ncbi:MAG: amidohydrolase family protein [Acidobacteriota bacterium]
MMKSISRRRFLRHSLAGLASGAATSVGPLVGCRQGISHQLNVIDVHVHASFSDPVLQRQARTLSQIEYSPEALLREMDQSQVEHAISIGFETEEGELSIHADNPMGGPADRLPAARFSQIGGINPYRLDQEGLRAIRKALESKQFCGLKIYLGYYHFPPEHDDYKRVYELAGEFQVPVVFHTGDTYSKNAKVRFAHPLPIDDVAVDFRHVTFLLAHLGNPWTIDSAELLYKNPNVYGDLSGFLVGGESYFRNPENAEGFAHVVERIQRAFAWVENPRKFLYGSDWPLVPMEPYLELMKRAIPPKHHEAVFYGNAREVFHLT